MLTDEPQRHYNQYHLPGTQALGRPAPNHAPMPVTRTVRASPEPGSIISAATTTAEWSVCLRTRSPWRIWGIAVAGGFGVVAGALSLHHWLGGVLGCGFIVGSAFEYLLPIRYRLDAEGIRCSYGLTRLSMSWQAVKRIDVNSSGILLSPFRRVSRLDAFRGIYLRYADEGQAGSRTHIEHLVRTYWEGAS